MQLGTQQVTYFWHSLRCICRLPLGWPMSIIDVQQRMVVKSSVPENSCKSALHQWTACQASCFALFLPSSTAAKSLLVLHVLQGAHELAGNGHPLLSIKSCMSAGAQDEREDTLLPIAEYPGGPPSNHEYSPQA